MYPRPCLNAANSSSFVDGALVALGVSIPTGYQFLFAPLRVIYTAAGPAAMKFLQQHVIDAVVAVGDRGAILTATTSASPTADHAGGHWHSCALAPSGWRRHGDGFSGWTGSNGCVSIVWRQRQWQRQQTADQSKIRHTQF